MTSDAASTPYECLVTIFYYIWLYVVVFGSIFTIWIIYSMYYSAFASYVPSLPMWKCCLDIRSLIIVDIDQYSTMFINWFFPCMINRVLLLVLSFRFSMFLNNLLQTVINLPTVISICFSVPSQSRVFAFQIILAYLKWLYMWEYHTITLYSGFALTRLRISIILLHFVVFATMFCACQVKSLSLWITTPRDLYWRAIPYPLYSLLRLFSHMSYFIYPCMNSILDFFLFIDMSLSTAHFSHMFMVRSRLESPMLAILVSSANICGYRTIYTRSQSVRSLVKMLNSRHEMPHPCPSPLPMWILPSFDQITRLLNIIWTDSSFRDMQFSHFLEQELVIYNIICLCKIYEEDQHWVFRVLFLLVF